MRQPDPGRLPQVYLQGLSSFPDNAPSPYAKLDVGAHDDKVLDIRFCHCNVPVGHFTFSRVGRDTRHSVLCLNTADNDWYQRGIPGISTSIETTATFLRKVISRLGCTYVRTIGSSMGGYAAVLFGDLLDADQIIACDPEFCLGDTLMRSWMWNSARYYDPQHIDVTAAVKRAGSRATISISIYDPMEAEAGLTMLREGAAPVLTKFFHGTPFHLDWQAVLTRPRDPPRSHIDQRLIAAPPEEPALVTSSLLYRDACRNRATVQAKKYDAARRAFPSIALYDAILCCAEENVEAADLYMKRYVRFRKSLGRDGVAEPLFDVQRRFGIADRAHCERIQNYLVPFLPPTYLDLSWTSMAAWTKYLRRLVSLA
jgi:hypothetical protein